MRHLARIGLLIAAATVAVTTSGCTHADAPTPAQPGNVQPGTAGPPTTATPMGTAETCPPPKDSTEICAAVMTYSRTPSGTACCPYPSPCTDSLQGPTYSDAKCSSPLGPSGH